MAGCRYTLALCSHIPKLVITGQNQLRILLSRRQPFCDMKEPLDIVKKQDSIHTVEVYDWKDAVLLITGGSKGMGSHVIRMALGEGAKFVTNLDKDAKAGLALQHELNLKYGTEVVKHVKCDVSDEQDLIENIGTALKNKENTYVVINNAGMLSDSSQNSQKEIETNVAALVTGSLTALELMRKDKHGKGGAIINISSVAALCPLPITPILNATKGAVVTFSLGLGSEKFYSRTGVRVMTICVGANDTEMNELGTLKSSDKGTSKAPMAHILLGQRDESAAQAVINIYKKGESGSTWLSNPNKPPEDLTDVVKKAYSLLTAPIFTVP